MRPSPRASQRLAVTLLWSATGVTVFVLLFIIVYIFWYGLPHLTWSFLTQPPRAMGRGGGVLPFIVATIEVTALAVLIAAPLGVATAIYLTEYTRESLLTRIIRFGSDVLAGVPSIIFGLFGFVFFVITLGMGLSILAGALTIAIMVLPTIIRTSEEAIRAVPRSFREVSYGLGATRWQTVTWVVVRAALPGIGTGIILSIGRSVGETAAVMLTAGSAMGMPVSLFDSGRTLSLHFFIMARELISMENAFATAAVLVLAILCTNICAYWLMQKFIVRTR